MKYRNADRLKGSPTGVENGSGCHGSDPDNTATQLVRVATRRSCEDDSCAESGSPGAFKITHSHDELDPTNTSRGRTPLPIAQLHRDRLGAIPEVRLQGHALHGTRCLIQVRDRGHQALAHRHRKGTAIDPQVHGMALERIRDRGAAIDVAHMGTIDHRNDEATTATTELVERRSLHRTGPTDARCTRCSEGEAMPLGAVGV